MKNVIILGSTGSVGTSALEVVRNLRHQYKVVGLSANSRWDLLAEQINEFEPKSVSLVEGKWLDDLQKKVPEKSVRIRTGKESVCELIAQEDADIVISAIVGAAGLPAAIEVIKTGKTLALANKEALVMAGNIIMPMAKERGAQILPVDSEHSAIFQAMMAGNRNEVKRVVITASGGPFCNHPKEKLSQVTLEEALKHPTWQMGQKITIDSATLMNKALEIIEAKWLFNLDTTQIDVIIHPESIIHSLVEFCDGSVIAQMGLPSMKVPIQFALTYPHRENGNVQNLDLAKLANLTFLQPDMDKFPALKLGYEAAKEGGTNGVTLNAANEVAVQAFLERKIKFTDIAKLVDKVIQKHNFVQDPDMKDIMLADDYARKETKKCLL
ncbi:MAG: 1-deoxy-D-xylulose-5-phosphate reductoisomerase [Candidatus Scalindua sp. AMX11]|nr:MAG: 1-deoxy-D-xylulose-5-phosphate reductoisomerase [Candidatus Scalindua sp.]NOG83361.1 1-deoxy-D-xylulose-5-phosphate reductoisomerase [Planctomycetota bacterium]RZV76738.1 MAG: 1-deoxy-D-xylulose-5-phosphate reductoisomerase [Candidatus Scalindua sp. SCAELEC01]TDE63363.1 MAG: 1-deoxy-D-xylulose-5-phosphate reductoisomerase [Candidatus Scalindua sp. AMX11]GJQ57354.1 MAG: 1-deoxy-D-xylulose 5-phosphate reductoisomerase [Candidatus Scalindua sp.]